MADLYDKTGRAIAVGDVLKVFHFVGARRKRYYMHKQVLDTIDLGPEGAKGRYLKIGHLNMDDEDYYTEYLDGRTLEGYEIVDSIKCDHYDRPKQAG